MRDGRRKYSCGFEQELPSKNVRSADLGNAIQSFVNNLTVSIEEAHKYIIDDVNGNTFLNFSNAGAGLQNFTTTEDMSTDIINNVTAVFYMKAIE